MRTYAVFIILLFVYPNLFSQTEAGIEQYHYIGPNNTSAIVPVVHLQSKKGWYGEARYNYDEVNTFSLLAGKSFFLGRNNGFIITPMAGIAMGDFSGATLGLNTEYESSGFYFNNQSQYSFSSTKSYSDFAFTWCEIGYQPLKWLYGGITFQYTREKSQTGDFEPGIMAGVNFKRVSLPFYYFNNFKGTRFFILGINWEWQRE
jgi:hypothetical protein